LIQITKNKHLRMQTSLFFLVELVEDLGWTFMKFFNKMLLFSKIMARISTKLPKLHANLLLWLIP
jgi:hypothetical protein